MSIILFKIQDDEPGAQIHLSRWLSDDEQAALALISAHWQQDGDDEEDDASRAWINCDADQAAIEAFLNSLN